MNSKSSLVALLTAALRAGVKAPQGNIGNISISSLLFN